eukprot:342821_1
MAMEEWVYSFICYTFGLYFGDDMKTVLVVLILLAIWDLIESYLALAHSYLEPIHEYHGQKTAELLQNTPKTRSVISLVLLAMQKLDLFAEFTGRDTRSSIFGDTLQEQKEI